MNAVISAIIVMLFGIFSFWLLQNLESAQVASRVAAPHEPDYFIEDMVRRTTNGDGVVHNILRAELVEHFPDDDSTELASPHLEIYNGEVEPWHVVAERGWVSSGNDVVLLQGDVEIWRLGLSGQRIYEVITSELRVLPKEQYAETDNPTIIVGPATVTHAIGMRANFAHSRLELVQRVRSKYEIKPQI